jgi:uncharacterized membrane protein
MQHSIDRLELLNVSRVRSSAFLHFSESDMEPSSMHYFPLAWPWLLILLVVFLAVVGLFELSILSFAYQRIGIHPRYVFTFLLLSLLGSAVNIPVAQLPPEQMVSHEIVNYFGVRYIVPTVEMWPRTIIAVNVGGALIPAALAIYLIARNRLYLQSLIAIVIVTLIVNHYARPVRGVGISVPIFIPPIVAAGVAMALAWGRAPPLAFIAGTLGTLIGADLLNLDKLRGLGAPIASIGGAGTFDGVFMTGIIAVLLLPIGAMEASRRRAPVV